MGNRRVDRLQRETCHRQPPALDAQPREGVTSAAAIKRELAELADELPAGSDVKLATVSALIAADHLDTAAKTLGMRTDLPADYLRGIISRRLGDYAEACRVFRVAAGYEVLWLIGHEIERQGDAAIARVLANFPHLLVDGRFNATPMCGIVQQVCLGGHQGLVTSIRRIQAIELATLIGWHCGKGTRTLQRILKTRRT